MHWWSNFTEFETVCWKTDLFTFAEGWIMISSNELCIWSCFWLGYLADMERGEGRLSKLESGRPPEGLKKSWGDWKSSIAVKWKDRNECKTKEANTLGTRPVAASSPSSLPACSYIPAPPCGYWSHYCGTPVRNWLRWSFGKGNQNEIWEAAERRSWIGVRASETTNLSCYIGGD